MKYLWITLSLLFLGCYSPNFCIVNNEDITDMYAGYIDEWKQECSSSFNKAEKEIFNVEPEPLPDDGTNEDPAKCVCRGTGIIVQGDGHKTPCPYHSKASIKR